MVRGLGKQVRSLWRRIGKAGAVRAAMLRNRPKVGSLNPQQMKRVIERTNHPGLQVAEVALLCGVGARQLMRPFLRRHDDPLLTQ